MDLVGIDFSQNQGKLHTCGGRKENEFPRKLLQSNSPKCEKWNMFRKIGTIKQDLSLSRII